MRVIHRDIKYPRIELRTGILTFILPNGDRPERLRRKYQGWIEKKEGFIMEALKQSRRKKIIQRNQQAFRRLVAETIRRISRTSEVRPTGVAYRAMRSKWASCSRGGRLTLNTFMQFLPAHLIEYILFHELQHLRERRHNGEFWGLMKWRYPDFRERERELFGYWFLINRYTQANNLP